MFGGGAAGKTYRPRLQPSRAPLWDLWLVERSQPNKGESLLWRNRLRFKNVSTGTYLCVVQSNGHPNSLQRQRGTIDSGAHPSDGKWQYHLSPSKPVATLFKLSAAHRSSAPTAELIAYGSWARIQHVQSTTWLGTTGNQGGSSQDRSSQRGARHRRHSSLSQSTLSVSLASTTPTPADASLLYPTSSSNKTEQDVFEIQNVPDTERNEFFFVWSRRPPLLAVLGQMKARSVTRVAAQRAQRALVELG